MKNTRIVSTLLCLLLMWVGTACDRQIQPKLNDASPVLVVDAFINDKPEPQTIRLTQTIPYFDKTPPPVIKNATVFITDDKGKRFDFLFSAKDNYYRWTPSPTHPGFGKTGHRYKLTIELDGNTFEATSRKNPVPKIDDITFTLDDDNEYLGEFRARDLPGRGNAYWFKVYENGRKENADIKIAWDAANTPGAGLDGVEFIPPVRRLGFNFRPGNRVKVEIYSITQTAYQYLNQVRVQSNRPGGFAELFARPLANVTPNIKSNSKTPIPVLGCFCVSSVESFEKTLLNKP